MPKAKDPLDVILGRPDAKQYYDKWVAVKSQKDATILFSGDANYVFREVNKLSDKQREQAVCFYVMPPMGIYQ